MSKKLERSNRGVPLFSLHSKRVTAKIGRISAKKIERERERDPSNFYWQVPYLNDVGILSEVRRAHGRESDLLKFGKAFLLVQDGAKFLEELEFVGNRYLERKSRVVADGQR